MNFTAITYFLGQVTTTTQTQPTTQQVESGFVYVIAAFTAVWLLIAAYLFWLQRRQESLRQEVEQLRQEEADRQQAAQVAPAPRFSELDLDPKLEATGPAQTTQGNLRG